MSVPINYLSNPGKKLRLISGDPEAFRDILSLIDQYNGMYSHISFTTVNSN